MRISDQTAVCLTRYSLHIKIRFKTNNNNYETSITPISSKRIELSGAPSAGIGKTHSPGTMQSSPTMISWKGKLRKNKLV